MGFADATKAFISNFVKFDGRSTRSEYWWPMLAIFILNILIGVISSMSSSIGGILSMLFSLAIIIPSIAVGIRRLHDLDKSGWWLLIGLIPLLGAIVLIFFFVQRGTVGSNQYGPDPLGGAV